MEQRDKICDPLENNYNLPEGELNVFYLDKNNHAIFGVEIGLGDNQAFTWYIASAGEHEAFVFLYLGDDWGETLTSLRDEKIFEIAKEAWPYFCNALSNGYNDNYNSPALISLPILEDNCAAYCLALKAENIAYDGLDSIINRYTTEKACTLLNYYFEMLTQFNENKPSTVKAAWSGFVEGVALCNRTHTVLKTAKFIGKFLGF